MWSDPYSRLYQRAHNSLWENLWIWMIFSAAWWIIEAVLCKTAHSVQGDSGELLWARCAPTSSPSVCQWSCLLSIDSVLIWEDKVKTYWIGHVRPGWNMNFASSSTWFVLCSPFSFRKYHWNDEACTYFSRTAKSLHNEPIWIFPLAHSWDVLQRKRDGSWGSGCSGLRVDIWVAISATWSPPTTDSRPRSCSL